MNKTQLIDAIAKKASITKVDAKKALDAFINVTGEALKAGDKIALIGRNNPRWCITYIGTVTYGAVIVPLLQDFTAAKKPGRTGRNPRTGASIKIAAKNVVKFKAGAELNALVK